MIHQLLIPIRFVHRNPFAEMISGTVSPLERNPQSPKGWKNRESDGIGLGIVVALQKSDGHKGLENFPLATPIRSASSLMSIDCGGDSGLDDHEHSAGGLRAFRPVDFLSDCYLCRKNLRGKDIYMYREKAFCSMECRCQQIMSDEFQEKCGSEALRSSEISQSPYTDDRLFFMGITAS